MLTIRRYQAADYEIVWDLHHRALGPTGALIRGGKYNDDMHDIENYYINNHGEFLVGLLEGKIVCMGAIRKKSDTLAEVKRMRVYPEYQRMGFGQQILNKLEERAIQLGYTQLCLDTTTRQTAAQNFYQKNGYIEIRREMIPSYDLELIFYEKKLKTNLEIFNRSIKYLESDVLKNLATLKYLIEYREKSEIQLIESADEWALEISMPTSILSYDTITYPSAKQAVFINGNSKDLKQKLLINLPDEYYILRLSEELGMSCLEDRFHIQKTNTFISYSCSILDTLSRNNTVPRNTQITPQAISLIIKNNYSEAEVRKYFENGAAWFGFIEHNEIKSICFVYQNYNNIWEIAGLHTLEPYRHKGYARIVVSSAIKYLLERNLMPRYNVNDNNSNSIKLALSLKMKPFLKIDHYLLNCKRS